MKKGLIIIISTILISALILNYVNKMDDGQLRANAMLLTEIQPQLTMQQARDLIGMATAVLVIHSCDDTDDGMDYEHYGEVTVSYSYGVLSATKTFQDQCTSKNLLFEQYCKDGKYYNIFTNCKYGCRFGECSASPEDENMATKCQDYDGGIDYYVASGVYGLDRTKTYQVVNDSCYRNGVPVNYCYGQNCNLREYGCRGDYITYYTTNCTYGCEYGACRTTECAMEGEFKSTNCCLGLVPIKADHLVNNSCQKFDGNYCTKCGNGICEAPENPCNCLTDCPATCTDSDGGANYYIRGTATSNAPEPYYNVVTDYCINVSGSQYVQEAVCQGNGIIGVTGYNCPNGCTNGRCIAGMNNTCVDSDGLDFNTRGTVRGTLSGLYFEGSDVCINSSAVMETYCDGTNYETTISPCTYGCYNGSCKSNPSCGDGTIQPGELCDITVPSGITCTSLGFTGGTVKCTNNCRLNTTLCASNSTGCSDTDGGKNSTEKGTTCVGTDCRTDFCDGTDYVIEFYCGTRGRLSTYMRCSGGCLNGVCATQYTGCADTDGINYTMRGTVNDQYGTWTDYCRYQANPLYNDTRVLVEYYCLSNTKVVSEHYCTNMCRDGICI